MYGFDKDGVKAKVENDGQYKIVIRGKEFFRYLIYKLLHLFIIIYPFFDAL